MNEHSRYTDFEHICLTRNPDGCYKLVCGTCGGVFYKETTLDEGFAGLVRLVAGRARIHRFSDEEGRSIRSVRIDSDSQIKLAENIKSSDLKMILELNKNNLSWFGYLTRAIEVCNEREAAEILSTKLLNEFVKIVHDPSLINLLNHKIESGGYITIDDIYKVEQDLKTQFR